MTFSIESSLLRICSIRWFANVGDDRTFPNSHLALAQVFSWKEAIERRGSIGASNALLEASGMLTRTLGAEFRLEYRQWNRIAGVVREIMEEQLLPGVDALIDNIAEIARGKFGPELIKDSIRWDVSHFAMEQAYAELVPPRFYTHMLAFYQAGHFPCDWDEQWPNGKMWVF